MIDRATVDRIYAAADIVDIVSDFVTLKRAGVNYKACCPFHDEDTPSFIVSPAKGLFKCFGCGKGGNAVTFVMEHEKMTYPEALKFVGKKYGIEVEDREVSEEEKQRNDDRESMMVVNSWAFDYFKQQLTDTDEGLSVGKSYLRQRGFTDATIARFGLGYCPSKGDQMTQAALAAGYKEQFLTGTGLSIKRETGGWYDRFCGRVIFPIHSISGRVIAFGGRVMRKDDRTAKYLNSPESPVYSKTNSLYGLYFAKGAITKQNYCILVEGYTDVIQMHQKGIENVVASSGTSLTTEQIRL
ncbi:MAG: DNA primase, partial [Tidjanibacter sp.]|nr:DNA primase [Tidjanibacter sp.]